MTMPSYQVQLQETLEYLVTVDAATEEEAEEIAEAQWLKEPNPEEFYGYEVIAAIHAIRANELEPAGENP